MKCFTVFLFMVARQMHCTGDIMFKDRLLPKLENMITAQQCPSNSAQDLVNEFLAPPRSQSFSGVVKNQLNKKVFREEFQKRSTQSFDQSSLLLQNQGTLKEKSTLNRWTATMRGDNSSTSNVIQRTKTFSKYLSSSKRETFTKNKSRTDKFFNNGIVSAQNEFLVGFNTESAAEEKNHYPPANTESQSSVFLSKVKTREVYI